MYKKLISIIVAVALTACLAANVEAQSIFSQIKNDVKSALKKRVSGQGVQPKEYKAPGYGDGLHSKLMHYDWHYEKFDPDSINGYMHLRVGAASLDQFNNAVGGLKTCDGMYAGYALLHLNKLSPSDARYCLDREKMNDSTATMKTVQDRMDKIAAQIRAGGKFYTRGTINKIYTSQSVFGGPFGKKVPDNEAIISFGGTKVNLPVEPPSNTIFNFVGKGWYQSGTVRGYMGNVYLLKFKVESKVQSHLPVMAQKSYVFYTLGKPRNKRRSTFERGVTIYDVQVHVDRVILVDDTYKVSLSTN